MDAARTLPPDPLRQSDSPLRQSASAASAASDTATLPAQPPPPDPAARPTPVMELP